MIVLKGDHDKVSQAVSVIDSAFSMPYSLNNLYATDNDFIDWMD